MQNKMLGFILIWTFIQISFQCGEGCLKCSTEKQCELCDSLNAYVLIKNSCSLQKDPSCLAYDLQGRCKSCASNYYLQPELKKCFKVQNLNLVDHCSEYNSQSECSVCEPHFYLSEFLCLQVDLKIDRCLVYDTSKSCSKCEAGYLVSISQRKCLPTPPTTHCLSYSLNKCTKCNQDYAKDDGLFLRDFLQEKTKDFTGINKEDTFLFFSALPVFYQEICIKPTVSNCLEFQDYKTCLKCDSGFFLEENQCRENPSNFISNCRRYKSLKKCIECENGFFLTFDSQCEEGKKISGCQLYDGTVTFSSCLRCQENQFLSSFACTDRVNKEIQNCELLDSREDRCEKCATDFRLSADQLNCLPVINNCVAYSDSQSRGGEGGKDRGKCQKCKNGFFSKENECLAGNIENCEIYKEGENSCIKCLNQFYLQDGICHSQSSLSYCQVYSSLAPGVCEACLEGTDQFTQMTKCSPVNRIADCTRYSDVNTCQECAPGFDRKDNKCTRLLKSLNCERSVDGVCQQCKENFFLQNNICQKPLEFELLNCHRKGGIVSGYQKCSSCEEFHVSINYQHHRVCMDATHSDFQKYTSSSDGAQNCKVMKFREGVVECHECGEGFLLNEEFKCIQKHLCAGTEQKIALVIENQRIVDFRKNLCINLVAGCRILGISLNPQGGIEQKCVECQPGFLKVVDFASSEEIIVLSEATQIQGQFNTLKLISSLCEQDTLTRIRPYETTAQNFLNCEYWYNFPTFNENGCAKCSHGKFGKVQNWGVPDCFKYDENSKCLQCLNQFRIEGSGLKCSLMILIPHCQWYQENVSTCQKCNDNYFLFQNTCKPVTDVKHCADYQIYLNDRCIECKKDLFLYESPSRQQFCIKPISKCRGYKLISSVFDPVICNDCIEGFFPDPREGCVRGTVEHCWLYDQLNKQNLCRKYTNYIPLMSLNVCHQVIPVEGCRTYTTRLNVLADYEVVCETCVDETHYKSGDFCCPHGTFNQNGNCEPILINECKESTEAMNCSTCLDDYQFDHYMNELTIPYKCCGVRTSWNPIESQCSSKIELQENINHCVVFDKQKTKSCLICDDGFYISQNQFLLEGDDGTNFPYYNGYCCPEGTYYHYSEVNGHLCQAITIPNCKQMNNVYETQLFSYLGTVQRECTKCETGFSRHKVGSAAICCNDDTEYFKDDACHTKPVGCKGYDTSNDYCISCIDTFLQYTKVTGTNGNPDHVICCDYNATPRQWYQNQSGVETCTAKGGTQNALSFDYSIEAYCILTNFDVSHATILEASCVKCIDGYFPSGYKSQKCCFSGMMWNGVQGKCLTESYFKNCLILKEISQLTDPFCDQCRSGYYLNNGICTPNYKTHQPSGSFPILSIISAYKCLQIEDGENTGSSRCLLCEEGYLLNNGVCERKMMIQSGGLAYNLRAFVKNCALFDAASNTCSSCISGAQKWDGNLCCKTNEKVSENECVQEKNTFNLSTLLKTRMPVDNCLFYEGLFCTSCQQGFIFIENSCVKIAEAQKKCNFHLINENCKSTTQAKLVLCECEVCSSIAYLSGGVCCPHGTKWDGTKFVCVKISDPLCAQHDGTSCTQCFQDPTKKLAVSQFFWMTQNSDGFVIGLSNQQLLVTLPDFSANFYISSGLCCALWTYNNAGICEPITISNCKRGELSAEGTQTCTLCEDMSKEPDANKTACVDKAATTDYYSPVGSPIKVAKGHFWDFESQRVQKIFEANCEETNDKRTCSKCATDYRVSSLRAKFVLNIPSNQLHIGVKDTVNVVLCVPINADVMEYKDTKNYSSCLNWNPATKACTECSSGAYLSSAICCYEGKVAVLSEGFKTCVPIQNQQQGCSAYEIVEGTCRKCQEGYTLSFGVCCADKKSDGVFLSKTYRDIFKETFNCDLIPYNCYKYNQISQQCELCEQDNYLVEGKCVPSLKYYNNNILVNITDHFPGCLQLNNDLECIETQEGNYLYNGVSCAAGFYSSGGTPPTCTAAISSKEEKFEKCTKIDIYDRCFECAADSYVSNGICCQKGKYFDTFVKKCIAIYKYRNCLHGSVDKISDCSKCKDGFYFSKGYCVEEGKLIADELGTEEPITIPGCIQAETDTTCRKCQGLQIVFDNTCQLLEDIDQPQRIDDCEVIQSGDSPVCLQCKEGMYLSEQKCCSQGFKHDGTSCVSLQDFSLDCGKWQDEQCVLCQPSNGFETYLSGNLACCLVGFFASTATLCQEFQIDDCLQSDDGESCKKCTTGFKLLNGQCSSIGAEDIQNCLIIESTVVDEQEIQVCLLCAEGFYPEQENKVCTAQPVNEDCLLWKENSKGCEICNDGKYWDGQSCCNDEFFSYVTGVSETPVLCRAMSFVSIEGCSKVVNGECVECTNGEMVSGGKCCPVGEFSVEGVCTQSTILDLRKCKKLSSLDQCEFMTDELGNDVSCSDSYYFNDFGCCAHGQRFLYNECTTFTGTYADCKKLNGGNCQQCETGQLSRGVCVPSGQTSVLGVATNISSIPHCTKLNSENSYFCETCEANYTLTLNNLCCTKASSSTNPAAEEFYFDPISRTCTKIESTGIKSVDVFTGDTLTCIEANFLPTGNKCCSQGQLWNSTKDNGDGTFGGCQTSSVATNCSLFTLKETDDYSNCSQCNAGFTLIIEGVSTQCLTSTSQEDSPLKVIKVDGNFFELPSDNYNACTQMDSTNKCIACDPSDHYLLQAACVDYESKWDVNGGVYSQSSAITNCKIASQASPADQCSYCITGFTLTNETTCTEQTDSYPMKDCAIMSSDPERCQTCAELATSHSNGTKKICCPYVQENISFNVFFKIFIPNPDFLSCQLYFIEISKCAQYNQQTNQCVVCKSPNYLSNNNTCCREGYQYNNKRFYCERIPSSTKCVRVFNSLCIMCDPLQTTTYLNNGNCCSHTLFFDSTTNQCQPIGRNCKKSQHPTGATCEQCLEGHSPYGEYCCPIGQFLSSNQCIQNSINNCFHQIDENTCSSCNQGFTLFQQNSFLSSEKDVCCMQYQFYDRSAKTCVSQFILEEFDASCEQWDRKHMKCLKCHKAKYLTNGRCCDEGEFFDVITSTCADISQISLVSILGNCLQVSDQNICVKCKPQFFFRQSQQKCVAPDLVIPHCVNYDAEVIDCIECASGRYLLRNRCPVFGQSVGPDLNFDPPTMDVTETFPILNCFVYYQFNLLYNKCKQCNPDSKTYLTNIDQTCCPFNHFYNQGKKQCLETNLFPNCREFVANEPNNCLACDNGYFLTVLKEGLKRCVKFSTPDQECLISHIGILGSQNTLKCSQCRNQGVEYVLFPNKVLKKFFVEFEPIFFCAFYETTNLLSSSTLKCVQCSDNHINYLKNEGGGQECKVRSRFIGETDINDCSEFEPDSDQCKKCKEGFFLSPANGLRRCFKNPLNCKVFDNFTTPRNPYCIQCVDNYTMILVGRERTCVPQEQLSQLESQPPTFYPGFIENCEENPLCKDEYLGGISGTLQRLFSCHVCTNEGFIPFVSVRTQGQKIKGIQRYKTPINLNDRQDLGAEFKNSQCLRVSEEVFGIAEGEFKFPLNCALGIINANLPAISESTVFLAQKHKLGVYCAACRPGFKALKSSVFEDLHHIYKCSFISNCEEKGKAFNECDKCATGFTFKFLKGTVFKDECVKYKEDLHCLVSEEIEGKRQCRYCQVGFSFNHDGVCDKIALGLCDNQKLEFLTPEKRPLSTEAEFALQRFLGGFGCQECDDEKVSLILQEKEKSWFCSDSEYLRDSFLKNDTNFDPLCRYYQANTEFPICSGCQSTAVLNQNHECLLLTWELSNCEVAENSKTCIECAEGYLNSFGVCVAKDIENCVDFDIDLSNREVICTQCETNYGLSENTCVQNHFNPCKKVDTQRKCVSCHFGFNLVKLRNNQKECLPVSSHQNCSSYDSTAFDRKQIICRECSSNDFILENLEKPYQVCNLLIAVRNCVKYDVQSTFSASSLDCLQCEPGFYLEKNECFSRGISVDQCLTYQEDSEMCKSCAETHYLDVETNQCMKNPVGVNQCRVYQAQTICSVCNSNYYPDQGKCLPVDEAKILKGCWTYDSNQICIECQENQLKVQGKCVSVLARNCQTYKSETQCEKCHLGFEISQEEEGVLSCLETQKPVIENCLRVSDTKPFECLLCFEHHYFDGEKCIAINSEQTIEKCQIYQNRFSCRKCRKYHILSHDKKFCLIEKNRNCESFQEQKQGFCVRCEPGFVLNEKDECVEENALRNKNCLLWEQTGEQCHVCATGFSMLSPGTCSANKSILGVSENMIAEEIFFSHGFILSFLSMAMAVFLA